jgi:hypothetical protein
MGLQQGLDFFQVTHLVDAQQVIEAYIMQIKTIPIMKDLANMQRDAQKRHEEVLNMIESLSDTTSSDRASSVQ